ncbi:MAG: hypothetical protein ACOZCL_15295 [Bacillota bacterium]
MKNANRLRLKLSFIISLFLIIFMIVSFHIFYDIKESTSKPSEGWGRDITVKNEVPYKKSPAVKMSENTSDILIANENGFERISIDRKTGKHSIVPLMIKGIEINKLASFQWADDFIAWSENFDLFFSSLGENGSYSEKKLVLNDVYDFQIIKNLDSYLIAAASKTGVKLLKYSDGAFSSYGEEFPFENAKGVSAVSDDSGVVYLAAYKDMNGVLFPLKYLKYKDESWEALSHDIKNNNDASWSVQDIEIGIDDNDVYIFYTMKSWGKSKTYYCTAPINSTVNELNFSRLYLSENEHELQDTNSNEIVSCYAPAEGQIQDRTGLSSEYNSNLYCIKQAGEKLKVITVSNTENIKKQERFTIYTLTLENGIVERKEKAVNNKPWVSLFGVSSLDDDLSIAFLTSAGIAKSDVSYTENGSEFVEMVSKSRLSDLVASCMNLFPKYLLGLFLGLLKSVMFFPALFWILAVEYFNIKKFGKNPNMVFYISIAVYLIIKLLTMNVYYSTDAMLVMPSILKFSNSPYFFGTGTLLISFILFRLLKKINVNIGIIIAFLSFALIDISLTSLLYAPYML